MRYYMTNWHKNKVILSGYSLGADVLPFMINRLPADLASKVDLVVLIGPSATVDFKFHLTNWLGGSGKGEYQVKPEIDKLKDDHVLCFYGEKDTDVICDQLDTSFVKIIPLPGGHLVKGRYSPIAQEIINYTRAAGD